MTGQIVAASQQGSTPYSSYVQTEVLHSLQKLVSDSPVEMAFLVNVQIMELHWSLIAYELRAAQRELRGDRVAAANRTIRRAVTHFEACNATWRSLSWMTPSDLMPILKALAATHGKDTALQGWTYRHIVFLLGIKDREPLTHFEPQPHRHAELKEALAQPSLYDDVLLALERSGRPIPRSDLERDYSEPYRRSEAVEKAWVEIYDLDDPADPWRALGEALTDLATEFGNWKYLHLLATRRTFGARPAYHGVSGVEWLRPTLDEVPFPELWDARSVVAAVPA